MAQSVCTRTGVRRSLKFRNFMDHPKVGGIKKEIISELQDNIEKSFQNDLSLKKNV